MKFMITIRFRPEDRPAIDPLIPQERERVIELRKQGVLEAIYISSDGSPVWLVMQGESQAAVQESLKTFPLFPFMEVEISSLL